MSKWYEQSEIIAVRQAVAEKLEVPFGKVEAASTFWERVAEAGLLVKAIALYDDLAAEQAEWRGMKRETKKEFEARVEREGRREEAERLRAEFVEIGLSQREVQEELVNRIQPLDGTPTRPWSTPDPWEHGRLFRKKADQEQFRIW